MRESRAVIAFVGQWGHALAASLFGAMAIWLAQRSAREHKGRLLILATFGTAAWALAVAMGGRTALVGQLTEHARNAAWLGFMYGLWRQGQGGKGLFSIALLYGVLSATIGLEIAVDILPLWLIGSPRLLEAGYLASMVLHMVVAVGALVLVHNLYTAATPDARAAIRLHMVGLAAMWTYDLNLYTVSYLARGWSYELFELRGIAVVLIAPIFGLGAQRNRNWAIQLSRTVTFQSLSLIAIGSYLAVLIVVTSALELIGGEFVRTAQVAFVFGASVAALVLLPSKSFRAWFRVKVSKHLFRHRYDYRSEWLRFTDTLGRPGEGAEPLQTRVVQAIADITESPGGLLLVPDAAGTLVAQACWNWQLVDPPASGASAETAAWFARTGRVVELDALRENDDAGDETASFVPQWIISEPLAWAIVPLVHFDRLAGLVLLERPPINRTLDWEDFDLLRVVGRQVASYLAEAQGQEALSDVKRFDEFNRRFAFIMHDVKNLVSQLTLVTRNAERHADNPEFRADMIATLQNSTARMNDLLARLSQHNKGRAEDPRPVAAGALVEGVAATKRPVHPVVVSGDGGQIVLADPPRLEQALSHLIQNAIDASPPTEPVTVNIQRLNREVAIAVCDNGCGMSATFIRERLFRPFTSTKDGGFGIGAYEARALILAMGGRIEVTSREGVGSSFSIILPVAGEALGRPLPTPAEAA
jgi:putative PEP-CTERM system histidine kinase